MLSEKYPSLVFMSDLELVLMRHEAIELKDSDFVSAIDLEMKRRIDEGENVSDRS